MSTNHPRCLYESSIRDFLSKEKASVFSTLCENYHGDVLTTQREAWIKEIEIMLAVLKSYQSTENARIIFEYDIPRLGKRIDVVLLMNGIVFCVEFKAGQNQVLEADVDQVLDYALDLKNFHKLSQDHLIVPILVATETTRLSTVIQMSVYDDSVVNPLVTGENGLASLIDKTLNQYPNEPPIHPNWVISPYAPTPTIIEAARTLYESHSVEDITRHEADQVSTDQTISYILEVIKKSKANNEKSICFVTGVPGAGKTLVGLDVAVKQTYQEGDKPSEDEGAVYLSGNGPLVAVLTEALARDNYEKCKDRGEAKKLTDSRREVGKFIQIIHRYRDNMLAKIKNPVENGILEIDPEKAVRMKDAGFGEVEHVAIFDEAQRSWTHKRLADYLKRGGTYGNKLKVPNFPVSEAAFLIWSLDQREDWATIICLVGGGQEINTGEAGISEWIKALNEIFTHWKVYISPQLTEPEYAEARFKELFKRASNVKYSKVLDSTFENNLMMIDSMLPEIYGHFILYHFMTMSEKHIDCEALCLLLEKENPLGYSKPNFYTYKIKKLLCASALGMTPGKEWDGNESATGGYVIVKRDGEVLCYHIYNRNFFESYLLKNTTIDRPSASRHDYAYVFKSDGKYYIDMNIQIRFKSISNSQKNHDTDDELFKRLSKYINDYSSVYNK